MKRNCGELVILIIASAIIYIVVKYNYEYEKVAIHQQVLLLQQHKKSNVEFTITNNVGSNWTSATVLLLNGQLLIVAYNDQTNPVGSWVLEPNKRKDLRLISLGNKRSKK